MGQTCNIEGVGTQKCTRMLFALKLMGFAMLVRIVTSVMLSTFSAFWKMPHTSSIAIQLDSSDSILGQCEKGCFQNMS